MLPTITASSIKYHKFRNVEAKRKQRNPTPWALLVVLIIASLVMIYTRVSSLNSPEYKEHAVHSKYLNMAPLQTASMEERTGSWKLTREVYDMAFNHPNAHVVSEDNPRLIQFPSLLSAEERTHLINLAKRDLHRSHVVSSNVSEQVNDARTSYGSWPKHDDFMQMLEDRIHRLLGIPNEFGEGIYVLDYKQGQQYKPHEDNCVSHKGGILDSACQDFLKRAGGPQCGPGHGGVSCGDRIATFILVLQAPEEGGRTVFPLADISNKRMAGAKRLSGADWYCDQEEILGVTPKSGDGILFWDYKPLAPGDTAKPEDGQATPVPGAQHSGCPVKKGEKWIATRWIRSSTFT